MIQNIINKELVANNQGKKLTRTTFLCSCGKIHSAWQKDINYGNVKSCGCLQKINHYKTHNKSNSRVYTTWINMKRRCDDINAPYYKNYGARGIIYNPTWKEFINFYNDMGEIPENKTLDRIDVNKNYCKENCRWATYIEQASNRRNNRIIFYKNKKYTLAELSRKFKINRKTLWIRLKRGWSLEKAITT